MEDAPQSRKIAAIEEVKDDAESDQTTHLKPERAIRQIANAPHVNKIPISNREETRQKSVRIAIETANILDNKSGLLKSSKNASNSTAENDLNAQNSGNEQNHTEPTKTETSGLSTVFHIASNCQRIGVDEAIITATVSGMPCVFMIDSGAQVNTFTEDMFKQLTMNANYWNKTLQICRQCIVSLGEENCITIIGACG
ncbi:uncharacterized protein LOC110674305 [Aedes aegypti]|uniref:Uncharacterized protein n=1 Tax=Aedes aegypti TaxID=7159 RepID=A0A6I8TY12_AEDAE|nr:uncharacterized protein LOC110674305 [Aedes aegypti]